MSYLALARRAPRTLGFGFLHALAATAGQTFVISVFLPAIRLEFGLDAAQIAVLFTATTVGSALVLWQVGRAVDRCDLVRYSLVSGVVLAGGWLVAASATSLPVFIAALFALRLGGNGLLNHIALTATARHFTVDRGKALALVSLGFTLEALVGVSAVQLIEVFGWRSAMAAMSGLVLTIVAVCAWLVRSDVSFRRPPRSREIEPGRGTEGARRRAAGGTRYLVATAPLFVAPALIGTALVFHGSVLAEAKGYTLQWFAASFLGFALSRLVASLGVGPLIDRFGAAPLFTLHTLPFCVGLAMLAESSSPLAAPVFWVCAGITSGLSATLQVAVAAERVEPGRLGVVRSVLAAVVILSAAAGPVLYGVLIASGWSIPLLLWISVAAMIGATGLGLAAQAWSARAWKTRRRDGCAS